MSNRIEIAKKFLDFEHRNKLLYFNVQDVFIWQIARVWLFIDILNASTKGNFTSENHFNFKENIFRLLRILVNGVLRNPYIDFRKSDILVFRSSRRYLCKNEYIDIYTQNLVEKLKKDKARLTVYEMEPENVETRSINAEKHIDFIQVASKALQKINFQKFSSSEIDEIKKIQQNLKEEFGFEADLVTQFKDYFRKFKAEQFLYNILFWIKKPKEIFIVSSSDKQALIFAAKSRQIVVNELQHGLMSNMDAIMNYPYTEEESLQYFPNRFFSWDNVNMFFSKLPLKDENIRKISNGHIVNMLTETKNIPKEENTILIISQPFGSKDIQKFILHNIAELKDFKIIYKIHPTEDRDEFTSFLEAAKPYSNIEFLDNEQSIYALMKRAKYVVGIYSSALFEATAFNCEIILLNLPGVEMAFPLLNNPVNKLLDVNGKLIDILQ